MRASNALLPALAIATAVAAGVGVSAHRVDEFLQAARIDLRDDDVSIDLALTPGVDIADAIVGMIDRDHDGRMTSDEQADYAKHIVGGVTATLDGERLPLRVKRASFPHVDDLRSGIGTIRVQLSANHAALSQGRHQLFFSNRHHDGQSVYLANALVPVSSRISVLGQHRTTDQRELTIDYAAGTAQTRYASGGLMVGLVAAVLMVRYTRRQGNCA